MKFTFAPGSTPLDGYTIRRAIHRGGFGEVYYATSDEGRETALKLLQSNIDVELRGVRQCLNLSHPNLVTIFDVKQDKDDDYWIIMEYVPGDTLAEVIRRAPGGVSSDEAVRWIEGITAAVTHLHGRGLVHRDLKPGNIFADGETVKVGDVGLSKFIAPSKQSAQTQSVGTVYYMAPEVAQGKYGPAVDQYALGIIAYELLTGKVPFDGESTGEILLKHLTGQPDLSAVPETVRPVIAKALSKSPEERFVDVGAFAKAFCATLRGEVVDVATSTAAPATAQEVGTVDPTPVPQPATFGEHAALRWWKESPTRERVVTLGALPAAVLTGLATGETDGVMSLVTAIAWLIYLLIGSNTFRTAMTTCARPSEWATGPRTLAHWFHTRTGTFQAVMVGALPILLSLVSGQVDRVRGDEDQITYLMALMGLPICYDFWSRYGTRLLPMFWTTVVGCVVLWTGIGMDVFDDDVAGVASVILIGAFLVGLLIRSGSSLFTKLPVSGQVAVHDSYMKTKSWAPRIWTSIRYLAFTTIALVCCAAPRAADDDLVGFTAFLLPLFVIAAHWIPFGSPVERTFSLADVPVSPTPPAVPEPLAPQPEPVIAVAKTASPDAYVAPLTIDERVTQWASAASLAPLAITALTAVAAFWKPAMFGMMSDGGGTNAFGALTLFAVSSLVGAWALLGASQILSIDARSRFHTRVMNGLLGVGVGLSTWAVATWLETPFPNVNPRSAMFNELGDLPLVRSGQPTAWALAAFFGVLFFLRGWLRQMLPLREHRLRIGSVLMSVLVAWFVCQVVAFPVTWAMLWAAVTSCAVQSVAAWRPESLRGKRVRGVV